MSTDAVSSSALRTLADYQSSTKTSSKSGSSIDMDDFLKLFVAQLSCQDPLSSSSGSSSGTDYISQLAQITMLEQLSGLNDSLNASQVYGMIGNYVYIGESSDSDLIFGKVDGVIKEDGVNYLMVGGSLYDISEVYAVIDPDTASAATDDQVLKSADLIGKTVTASVTTTDSEGEQTVSTVTGKVEKILVQDGTIYLVIDDQNVKLDDITEIAETAAEAATA
jgi:flagellar basal-body rod modification protein FlgD